MFWLQVCLGRWFLWVSRLFPALPEPHLGGDWQERVTENFEHTVQNQDLNGWLGLSLVHVPGAVFLQLFGKPKPILLSKYRWNTWLVIPSILVRHPRHTGSGLPLFPNGAKQIIIFTYFITQSITRSASYLQIYQATCDMMCLWNTTHTTMMSPLPSSH